MMSESSDQSGSESKQVAVPREVTSAELLRGERCLVITHAGERYRLIETRNGKLMLQK